MTDELERARARREEQEQEAAARLADALFPRVDPRYRRAVARQQEQPAGQVFADTVEDIDRGMFWLEHGYYPGEEPAGS